MQEMYFIQYFDYCVYMSNLHRTGTIAVDLDFLWYINSIFQIYAQQKEIPLLQHRLAAGFVKKKRKKKPKIINLQHELKELRFSVFSNTMEPQYDFLLSVITVVYTVGAMCENICFYLQFHFGLKTLPLVLSDYTCLNTGFSKRAFVLWLDQRWRPERNIFPAERNACGFST